MISLIFESWKIDARSWVTSKPALDHSHLAELRDAFPAVVNRDMPPDTTRLVETLKIVSARLVDSRLWEHCEMRDRRRR